MEDPYKEFIGFNKISFYLDVLSGQYSSSLRNDKSKLDNMLMLTLVIGFIVLQLTIQMSLDFVAIFISSVLWLLLQLIPLRSQALITNKLRVLKNEQDFFPYATYLPTVAMYRYERFRTNLIGVNSEQIQLPNFGIMFTKTPTVELLSSYFYSPGNRQIANTSWKWPLSCLLDTLKYTRLVR